MDSWVRPSEPSGDVEGGERVREEGCKRSGDWNGGVEECRLVNRCDGAEVRCGREAREAGGESGAVFGDREADGGNSKNVVERFYGGGAERAADTADCVILCHLQGLDKVLRGPM